MERQWANSYILIIFDADAFLMRVLQTQTRVRNFLVLVSHAFFGTHISGLHCRCQSSGPWDGVCAREEWAKPSSLLCKQGPQSSGKKVQPDGERGPGAGVGL